MCTKPHHLRELNRRTICQSSSLGAITGDRAGDRGGGGPRKAACCGPGDGGPKDGFGEGARTYGEGERGGGPIEWRCEGVYGDGERGGGPIELLCEGVYGDGERGGGPIELLCEGVYGDGERGGGPIELLCEGEYGDGERGGANEGEGGTELG
jgi:hypothetical protein